MTEKEIEAYFVKRVKALGGYSYKFRSVTQRGVADRVACLPGGRVGHVQAVPLDGAVGPLGFRTSCVLK